MKIYHLHARDAARERLIGKMIEAFDRANTDEKISDEFLARAERVRDYESLVCVAARYARDLIAREPERVDFAALAAMCR